MSLVSRRQPSALVSNGLATATVALNIAGAAADAVPIAKQILNSAAHISATAERINRKREAMYSLIRKAEIYSTQIDIAVAGRLLDARLEHRLARLLSVFVKIEALLEEKAGRKKYPVRVWNKFIAKPNRAEELAADLDQEMTLFNLLTGIQLSLTVDDTARAVAEDSLYDGQFRRLRDCDVEKLDVIHKHKTDTEVVVWSSARVRDGQLMVVRHIESLAPSETKEVARWQSLSPSYNEFLENIEKVSTISGSHRYIVQLYGRHIRGPELVFKSGPGSMDLRFYLNCMGADGEEEARKRLTLAYKILDASAHLESAHGLTWEGHTAIVDENGEPCIGLFDDIVRANPGQSRPIELDFYCNIFIWTNYSYSEETGVVEEVHDSSLHAMITEQLRNGNDTDRLPRVWDIIQQEQLHVEYRKSMFPIISGNLSLSQESIARARSYFETNMNPQHPYYTCELSFIRYALATGGANISPQILSFTFLKGRWQYTIRVNAYTHDENHIQYHSFYIDIPAGGPPLIKIARAVGLPDDFERSWDDSVVFIYPQFGDEGEQTEEGSEIGDGEGADEDSDDSDAWGSSEDEEYAEYETADEGETTSDVVGEE